MSLTVLPNLLGPKYKKEEILPPIVFHRLKELDGLIAESEKGAWNYLKGSFNGKMDILLLNEHTKDISAVVDSMGDKNWGLISDSGLPILADPGSRLVAICRERGVKIDAVMGPSSIVLALLLSGFPAQRFAFSGYLPRKREELILEIKALERRSFKRDMTELFIEAPYRSYKMLEIILSSLRERTRVAICLELHSDLEEVIVGSVGELKRKKIDLRKKRSVFLIYAK